MTDSPRFQHAIDVKEQPILEKLLAIRGHLLLIKCDKSQYVKSKDVLDSYQEIIEQITQLNKIRQDKPTEQNRLDYVLDDCLQLVSLFFLTVGRNSEAPAAYSLTSTIKRLLDHLKEAKFFSKKDLASLSHQLKKIRSCIDKGRNEHDPAMLTLLEHRIDSCQNTLRELETSLSGVCATLEPTHERLVSILRCLSGMNTKPKFPEGEVKEYQKQLKEIEAKMDGSQKALQPSALSEEEQYIERLNHVSYASDQALPGKEVVLELLGRCLLWSEIMLNRKGKIDDRFADTYDSLLSIYRQLEKLSMTQAWSLRETDLYEYQRKLDRIDEARVDGEFVDNEGKPSEVFEQRAFLYLLRKSYANIYLMITSSEPVSEALLPVYNQLLTLRKCLLEVKKSGGVASPRELYPYSMKLNSIDNMRTDGKFVINGDIPEGQGTVTELMSECFDIAYELRTAAEEDEEDSDDDDTTTGGPALEPMRSHDADAGGRAGGPESRSNSMESGAMGAPLTAH